MDFTVLSLWALLYTAISHITTGLLTTPLTTTEEETAMAWQSPNLDFMVEPPWSWQEPSEQ